MGIAHLLYPEFLKGQQVCADAGICGLLKDWDCESCTALLVQISDMMVDPMKIEEAVTFLQDAYCSQHPDHPDCPGHIAHLIPLALPVLSQVLVDTSAEICQDINGVC